MFKRTGITIASQRPTVRATWAKVWRAIELPVYLLAATAVIALYITFAQ